MWYFSVLLQLDLWKYLTDATNTGKFCTLVEKALHTHSKAYIKMKHDRAQNVSISWKEGEVSSQINDERKNYPSLENVFVSQFGPHLYPKTCTLTLNLIGKTINRFHHQKLTSVVRMHLADEINKTYAHNAKLP